jgi:hypothetical protein
METKYFIISNKQKKADLEQAGALLYSLNQGMVIMSAVPVGDSVHYIVGWVMPGELNEEDAQIIRDNLSVTHPEAGRE